MNELRMYVEHLFEGKVLTADMIELKEEIYGNLVARYEDYVAGGMDAAEALEKTKASITSLDDVLTGDAEDAQGAYGAQGSQAGPANAAGSAAGETVGAGDAGAAETVRIPAADAPRARWPIVVGVLAAVVIIGAIGVAAFGFVRDSARSYEQDTTVQVDPRSDGQGATSSGTDTGTSTDGTSSQSGDAPVFDDPEDQREYEATMALMDQIDGGTAEALRSHVGLNLNDTETVLGLVQGLPLGTYAASLSGDGTGASLSIEYAAVDSDIEGDAVDCALAYDVVALMSIQPSLSSVQVTVNDDDDHRDDIDLYVFERATVESLLASATDNAITQVNDSLLESEDSWNQVRGYVATERFSDALMERSERN